MPVEKWSDTIAIVHLADDPQFTDDMQSLDVESARKSDVVLELSGVKFLNSSNMARLLKLRRQAGSTHRRLLLCGISNTIWGTFLVTGLDKVFDFCQDVPTALATLQMRSN